MFTPTETTSSPATRAPDRQYTAWQVLAIWAAATAPMTALAWIAWPLLTNATDLNPGMLFWLLMVVGMMWQFVLSVIILRRELGTLRWSLVAPRIWAQQPTPSSAAFSSPDGAVMNTRSGVRRSIAAAATMAVLLLTSCASTFTPATPTTQIRELSGVEGVELRTSGDLTIVSGAAESLTITAESSMIDNLTSDVRDGTLILDAAAGDSGWGRIEYTLTVPRVDLIRLAGSGDISGNSILAESATIDDTGSGDVSLSSSTTTDLAVTMTGSGDITIEGTTLSLRLSSEGSGNFDGSLLEARIANVDLSGSGSAHVVALRDLTAAVSGSGDIFYTGNPGNVVTSLDGSGEITLYNPDRDASQEEH
ncbi:DUF2807 domain-containing protein [Leifsonia sp. H3M29-4]|uniref:head GIN domain-containing protein n=1 Tax=Salinibacterium metalliresistens TaxID=3031321 RepID=UPI0023DAA2EB|nr:head GIN domain-containing protein [Salinibacterium metalliresistens]MDF1477698.1 DUF2807 domain-containing protein [Salinibacterium metalliresistens]